MAYFVSCDVKDCDEVCKVSAFGDHPEGWYTVSFYVTDEEEQERVIAQHEARVARVARPKRLAAPRVNMLRPVTVLRHVLMCSKHDVPEFDPESQAQAHGLLPPIMS